MTKRQQKERLFYESAYRCTICGRGLEDAGNWAVARIITASAAKTVSRDGKAIICSYCAGEKHRLGVGVFAQSLSLWKRFRYWLRVRRLYRDKRISRLKKELLLSEFSIFRRRPAFESPQYFSGRYQALMHETIGTCIYCGVPLLPQAVTYDHIVPKSKGGGDDASNLVIACMPCNVGRRNRSVDEFVESFPPERRSRFIHRVKELEHQKRLSHAKARLLLSYETAHTRRCRFRLRRRIVDITIKFVQT